MIGAPTGVFVQIQRLMNGALRRAAKRTGCELIMGGFYAPVPDLERLPDSHWEAPLPIPGVDLKIEESAKLLDKLSPAMRNFPSATVTLRKDMYGSADAEILYAVLRHFKPSRVIELGSGASSHVIEAARLADGFEYRIFDPFPWSATDVHPIPTADVRPLRAEDIPSEEFSRLRGGDVLFVDTTHTVKAGGDANRIILEVLPSLASGVLVHFHDIFLPFEYPRRWIVIDRRLWAEQYLLQAFLAFNAAWEVVLPCVALAHERPEDMERTVPSFPEEGSSGFWIRRR